MRTTEDDLVATLNLAYDPGFKGEVSQLRARALLQELSADTPADKWTYSAPRVTRNVTAALFSLMTLSLSNPRLLEKFEDSARQFALTWESLARLREASTQDTATINAAIAYELAGYQANAACLAKTLGTDFSNLERPTISQLAGAFLQRLFLQLRSVSERAQREPEITKPIERVLLSADTALAGRGFHDVTSYFLRGDEKKLGSANAWFEEAEAGLSSRGFMTESNIIHAIRSLIPVVKEKSTWSVLREVAKSDLRWERFLKLLSRGTGQNVFKSKSVSELWPSQIAALKKGLLDSWQGKVVKMPTSAGKTLIAELAIVHTLVNHPGAKAVYIAPYRALVSELQETFFNLFGDLGFTISSIIGKYESDEFEELLVSNADILIMTPEKLDLLQRARSDFLRDVRLFVLDEGQIINDTRRGVKFELLLTRMKRKLLNARFLFLSAVVPNETLQDFAKWFKADPQKDILTETWRPSIQRVAKFVWNGAGGYLEYVGTQDNPLLGRYVSDVIQQRTYEYVNLETGRTNSRRFPEAAKADISAELAFKFAGIGSVLVFCSQPKYTIYVAESLERRLNLTRLTNQDVPASIVGAESMRSVVASREWLGESHRITRLLRQGIAVHNGDLPEAVRNAVERDFRDKRLKVLVATNTLAQGVNLPIRTVIIHSCWRYSMEGGRMVRVLARDYWNIAGRAGRAGEETEGTIIHIIIDNKDESDFAYYVGRKDAVEPVNSILFEMLKGLAGERLTLENLREELDPEILALLVEEGSQPISDETISAVLGETLASVQASREKRDVQPLENAVRYTIDNINKIAKDNTYWSAYSSTGLSTASCEVLRGFILTKSDETLDLLKNANSGNLDRLATLFIQASLLVSAIQSEPAFGASLIELLKRWLAGTSIDKLATEYETLSSSEELARFIEDFFAYKLPWGVSAIIRIAQKTLGVGDDQLSTFTRFFPTMIKYGVPHPAASWAMAAGVPSRGVAIDLAALYLGSTDRHDYNNFLEWIGTVTDETLRHDLNLHGSILEDVSRVLFASGINPLLKNIPTVDEAIQKPTHVVGTAYENRWLAAQEARIGDTVRLVREYDNNLDRNAIRVQLNGQPLGYIERPLAQFLAPEIDCGLELEGRIVEVKRGKIPDILIKLDVKPETHS